MKYLIILFLLICTALHGQKKLSLSDTLSSQRGLFTTKVYKGSSVITDYQLSQKLYRSPKWSQKFKISRILLPAGPLVAGGGVYIAYDAIKGTPKVALIDGAEYPYVVRSLPQLLAGVAIFVSGMSMIESANETKANAVKWYNGYVKKSVEKSQEKTAYWQLGLQPSGNIGLAFRF